jgi:hypothetical protein
MVWWGNQEKSERSFGKNSMDEMDGMDVMDWMDGWGFLRGPSVDIGPVGLLIWAA